MPVPAPTDTGATTGPPRVAAPNPPPARPNTAHSLCSSRSSRPPSVSFFRRLPSAAAGSGRIPYLLFVPGCATGFAAGRLSVGRPYVMVWLGRPAKSLALFSCPPRAERCVDKAFSPASRLLLQPGLQVPQGNPVFIQLRDVFIL